MASLKDYIKLMRPHHYIKNMLVFIALGCSGQIFSLAKFVSASAGFAAFCMMSSAVYIINDIQDRKKDCSHPTKCHRPIASGRISPKKARFLMMLLFVFSALCNSLVFRPVSSILLVLYLILNLSYSFGLKDRPLIDVTILTSGFLIRVVYGAVITDVVISDWLWLTIIVLSFYFSLGKRRNELRSVHIEAGTRKVLQYYTDSFLDRNMYVCQTLTDVFYALWCMDSTTVSRYAFNLIFTVPIVLLITMKYSMDIEKDSDGDPVEVLFHDPQLLALCLIYFVMMFAMLYV